MLEGMKQLIRKGLLPSIGELREVFEYDPETGILRWKISNKRARAGEEAGCAPPSGYRNVCFNGCQMRVHRLAWALMTGAWPVMFIDHVDGHTTNNRWGNLQEVTQAQNMQKQQARSSSSSGVRGVWTSGNGVWRASIRVSGKNKYLGSFRSIEEAKKAREQAEVTYYGEFAPRPSVLD